MIDIKMMRKLNKEYEKLIEEIEKEINNENFSYDITEEQEYRAYLTSYSDDFSLSDYMTQRTIFKSKDREEFINIMKKLDGSEETFYRKDDGSGDYDLENNGE